MTETRNTLSFRFDRGGDGIDTPFLQIDGRTIEKRYLDHVTLVAVTGLPIACIDVLTCNCGVAGCAGYHDPLIIEMGDDVVTWHCPETCAEHLGVEKAHFDKTHYIQAIDNLRSEVERRFDAGRNFMMLMDVDWDEETDSTSDVRLDPRKEVEASREHFATERVLEFAAEMKGHYVDGVPWPGEGEPNL